MILGRSDLREVVLDSDHRYRIGPRTTNRRLRRQLDGWQVAAPFEHRSCKGLSRQLMASTLEAAAADLPRCIIPSSCFLLVLIIRLSSFSVSSNLSSISLSKPATPLSLALDPTGSEERFNPGVSISLSLAGSYPSSSALTIWDESRRVGPGSISLG